QLAAGVESAADFAGAGVDVDQLPTQPDRVGARTPGCDLGDPLLVVVTTGTGEDLLAKCKCGAGHHPRLVSGSGVKVNTTSRHAPAPPGRRHRVACIAR